MLDMRLGLYERMSPSERSAVEAEFDARLRDINEFLDEVRIEVTGLELLLVEMFEGTRPLRHE